MDDSLDYPELALQLLQLLGTALITLTRIPVMIARKSGTVPHVIAATEAHEPSADVIGSGERPVSTRPML